MVCDPRTYGNRNRYSIEFHRISGKLVNSTKGSGTKSGQIISRSAATEFAFWLQHIQTGSLLYGLGLLDSQIVEDAVDKTYEKCAENKTKSTDPTFTRKFSMRHMVSLGIVPLGYQYDKNGKKWFLDVASTVVKQHLPLRDFIRFLNSSVQRNPNTQVSSFRFTRKEVRILRGIINPGRSRVGPDLIRVTVWPQWWVAVYLINVFLQQPAMRNYIRAWATLPKVKPFIPKAAMSGIRVPTITW